MELIELVRAYPYQWIAIVYTLLGGMLAAYWNRKEPASVAYLALAVVVFYTPLLQALK